MKREENRAQKIWTAVGASSLTLLSGLGGALWGSTRNTSDSVTPQQQGADELGVARVDQLINEFRAGEIGAEEALARLALIKDLSADDRRLSSIVESYINQIESRRIQVLTTAEE